MVLAAALLMPLVMRWQWLSAPALIRVPAYPWTQRVDSLPVEEAAAPKSFIAQAALPASEIVPLADEHSAARAFSSSTEPAPAVPAQAASRPIPIATLLWLLYLGVCALLLARLLYGLAVTAHLWTTAEPVCLASDSDLPDGLRLRSSRRIASPVALASGVVLPVEYSQWDRQKLRVVLAHEHSHILQHDFYLQTLAGLHAAIFWFSPLAWWLKRKLSDLGEAVSDRAGLDAAVSRASYAQILLEFAALPRPALIGVAMANSSNLSDRIERFLNESRFRQAFAGSRRRALLAVLLVPAAIFAFTAMIRVEASAHSNVQAVADQAPPPPPPAPVPPSPSPLPPTPPPPPPMPPELQSGSADQPSNDASTKRVFSGSNNNYEAYSSSSDAGSYAVIIRHRPDVKYVGDWAQRLGPGFAKANKLAKGNFFWFTHGGKSYLLEDQDAVAGIYAMHAAIDALGKEQEELGRQQKELGKQMEEVGRKMKEATLPTPDMSKEIGDLEKQMAKLRTMQGKTMTTEEWADLESKLGNLQGKLGSIQGEIGAKQGAFGGEMGKLGGQMGELGGKQGELGAEQGRLAEEADRKIKAIIDKALKEGKARPVE
jgi:beta-lactamase regulating signal transducer with metallopeptidase domain